MMSSRSELQQRREVITTWSWQCTNGSQHKYNGSETLHTSSLKSWVVECCMACMYSWGWSQNFIFMKFCAWCGIHKNANTSTLLIQKFICEITILSKKCKFHFNWQFTNYKSHKLYCQHDISINSFATDKDFCSQTVLQPASSDNSIVLLPGVSWSATVYLVYAVAMSVCDIMSYQ